jgi:hypothetical protein
MPKTEYPSAPAFWRAVISKYNAEKKLDRLLAKQVIPCNATDEFEMPLNSWAPIWAKIIKGREPPTKHYRAWLFKFFDGHIDEKEYNKVYSQNYVPNLASWDHPVVGTFDWPPFCDKEGSGGFLVTATKRFFTLAGKRDTKYETGPLGHLLTGEGGIHLSLALAETIPRTQKVRTFHTPGRVGINLVGKFDAAFFRRVRDALTVRELYEEGKLHEEEKLRVESDEVLRVVTVENEVGHEYIGSLPDVILVKREPLEAAVIGEVAVIGKITKKSELLKAAADLDSELSDKINEGWFFCADELTCLHKLTKLKKIDRDINPCLLFPLGTPQVTRSEQYARLPAYKIGLFTVPEYQEKIVGFLEKALKVYLENEHEKIAQEYAQLYKELVGVVTAAIGSLNETAKAYLFDSHIDSKDNFYTGVNQVRVLADRWCRHTLRLYPEQTEQDLNLPWHPILNRARSLVEPVANETRTPGERRSAVMYRELPPVITNGADGKTDFSIFGAVLGSLRPHVDLLEATRYKRIEVQSQLGSDNPATVAVGFFAVPPRLFDWRFFRFPIRLKFAGALLGKAKPEHLEECLRECDAILRILESGRHEAIELKSVQALLLDHGAAHNLLRDHGLTGDLVQLVDDTNKNRGRAFLEEAKKQPAIPAVVIADEITCLEVAGANGGTRHLQLLNHRLGGGTVGPDGTGTGAYFSVAVRSSASDWLHFFEQAIPLTLELHREKIAEAHNDLFWTLRKWVLDQLDLPPDRVEAWCRSVLLLDRPDSLSAEWKPVIELAEELRKTTARSAPKHEGKTAKRPSDSHRPAPPTGDSGR